MKKAIFFNFLFVFLVIFISCSSDDIEDFFADPDPHTKVCGVNMQFFRQWDEVQRQYYYYQVDLYNTLDNKVSVYLSDPNKGYDYLGRYLWPRDEKSFKIYIPTDTTIEVNIAFSIDGEYQDCQKNPTFLDL